MPSATAAFVDMGDAKNDEEEAGRADAGRRLGTAESGDTNAMVLLYASLRVIVE